MIRKKYINKNDCVALRGIKFRKVLTSDFVEILYTYVFRRADYEYHSESTRKFDYHGEIH